MHELPDGQERQPGVVSRSPAATGASHTHEAPCAPDSQRPARLAALYPQTLEALCGPDWGRVLRAHDEVSVDAPHPRQAFVRRGHTRAAPPRSPVPELVQAALGHAVPPPEGPNSAAALAQSAGPARVREEGGGMAFDMDLFDPVLGAIGVTIAVSDGRATARFKVADDQARRLFEAEGPRLRVALTDRGLKVDDIEVALTAP